MVDHSGLTGHMASRKSGDGLSRVQPGPDAPVDAQGRPGIPRIIHRIWFGSLLPHAYVEYGDMWRSLNPDWEVWDWGDDGTLKVLDLPAQDFRDRAKELCPGDHFRFKADILRLELLHEFGGLYVDMDVEPHRPIDDLLKGRQALVARSKNATSTGYHAITNCVMAATPQHPWLNALLDGLDEAVQRYQGKPLAHMIGPWHLDRTYREGEWPSVDVVQWDVLAPYLTHYWDNQRRRGAR